MKTKMNKKQFTIADAGVKTVVNFDSWNHLINGNINKIADDAYQIYKEHGFLKKGMTEDAYVEKMCNNLHDEVSELHEAWRNNKLRELCDKSDKMKSLGIEPLTCLEEELADIIIRALQDSRWLGIDILRAIKLKSDYNRTREYKHGNKRS